MISQVSEIVLEGADRELALNPGLNIVAGPIASGKTTFVRYLRFLLGGSLGQPPKEARTSVTAVSGTVNLNGKSFLIARPAVSTPNARVEIAGDDRTWRLPAYSSLDGNTYVNWLLQQMELPRIEVPSAPMKPDSDPTPISIGDYFLYSYLAQDELGFSVFGHRDPFKNIKRKYVFEITYGFYDLKTAQLQERLRKVQGQLRELRARETLFETFFEGTPVPTKNLIRTVCVTDRAVLGRRTITSVGMADVRSVEVDGRLASFGRSSGRRVSDRDAELEQLAVDARGAPGRVGAAHLADEFLNGARDAGPPGPTRPTLPAPVEPKASSMPAEDRVGLDDDERVPPTGPQVTQPRPEQPVDWPQPRSPSSLSLQDRQLMAQRGVLDLKRRLAPQARPERGEQHETHGSHGPGGYQADARSSMYRPRTRFPVGTSLPSYSPLERCPPNRIKLNVGRALLNAFRAIEAANPERLNGVFGNASWTDKAQMPDETLKNLIEHFSQHTLSLAKVPEDELGNGYEYLIKQFADDSGHTAQEFYTNRTLVHLMTQMLEPQPGDRIYDPTAGTAGMLISSMAEIKRRGGDARTLGLYGQERPRSSALERVPQRQVQPVAPQRRLCRCQIEPHRVPAAVEPFDPALAVAGLDDAGIRVPPGEIERRPLAPRHP